MRNPTVADGLGHAVPIEGRTQDGQAPIEVAAEDWMRAMGNLDRSPLVLDVRTEVLCRVLKLELLHTLSFRIAKEKTDHHVVEASVDELVDDASKRSFPPDVVELAQGESS